MTVRPKRHPTTLVNLLSTDPLLAYSKCQIASSLQIPYPFFEKNCVNVTKLIRWLLTWVGMVWQKTSPACWWQVALADPLPAPKGRLSGCRTPLPGWKKLSFLFISLRERHNFVCLKQYLSSLRCSFLKIVTRHLYNDTLCHTSQVSYMTLGTVCVCVRACVLTQELLLSLAAKNIRYFGVTRANLIGALFQVG